MAKPEAGGHAGFACCSSGPKLLLLVRPHITSLLLAEPVMTRIVPSSTCSYMHCMKQFAFRLCCVSKARRL